MAINSAQIVRFFDLSLIARGGRRAMLPVLGLACMTACGSAQAEDSPETDVSAGPGEALVEKAVDGPADAVEDEDVDLAFLRQDGFETFHFALDCVSVGDDGSVIGGEPLPVGNGRSLQCETAPLGSLSAIDAVASTGERFCALGQIDSFHGDGSPELAVSVTSTPEGAPWTLVGTHDGEEIQVAKVAGFGGGTAWPLWVDAHYAVVDLQPNPTAQLCTQFFGI
jgi:hypothetical protein